MAMLNHASGVMGQTYGVSTLGSKWREEDSHKGREETSKIKKNNECQLDHLGGETYLALRRRDQTFWLSRQMRSKLLPSKQINCLANNKHIELNYCPTNKSAIQLQITNNINAKQINQQFSKQFNQNFCPANKSAIQQTINNSANQLLSK